VAEGALTFVGWFCSNRQMPEHEIRAVADNLLQALRFFGRARGDAEIRDIGGASLIFCGLNYAAFNAAVQSRPVDGDKAELERLIRTSAAQFDSRNLRWTYWLCDDFLSKPLRQEAPSIFGRYGLRPLTEAPGMYAASLATPRRPLPPIEFRTVADERTRAAFADIMSVTFEIPRSVSNAVYGTERAWLGDFHGYVGYSNGQAVTTAASSVTDAVIGLYSVATLPQYRRFGFAESLMRQVIEQAITNDGIEHTVLQSTASGLSLYEQMGYRTVTKFRVYIAD
jgi:ribosomal protein S18 acetylase RimI-like enzyme